MQLIYAAGAGLLSTFTVLSVLSVIGAIFKWILWILLGIIGLVLLILLIVLLDPFFYHLNANKHEDIRADAKVFYLFHILKVAVQFADKKLVWRVTVFGKQIAGSDEVPEKDRSREARKQRREEKKRLEEEAAGKAKSPGGIAANSPEAEGAAASSVRPDGSELTLSEKVAAEKDKAMAEAVDQFHQSEAEAAGTAEAPEKTGEEAEGAEAAAEKSAVPAVVSGQPKAEVIITDRAMNDQKRLEEAKRRAREKAELKIRQKREQEEKARLKREETPEMAAARRSEESRQKAEKELERLKAKEEKKRLKEEKAKEKARIKEEKAREKQRKKEEALARKNAPKKSLSEVIDEKIDQVFDFIDKIFDTIDMILDAPDVIEEKLEPFMKYKDMFDEYPDKDKTVMALLRVLKKTLKPLVPKGCQIDALFGTGDPYTTARILGIYLTAAPLLFPGQSKKRYLNIQTDMQEKVIEADAALKGHFNIGSIIGPVLGAPFNKYIFRLIKFAYKLYKQSKKDKPEEEADAESEDTERDAA